FLPSGKVHMEPRLMDVSRHQPGHWGDTAVKRKLCIEGMAILARTLDQSKRFRIDLGPAEDRTLHRMRSDISERMNQRTSRREYRRGGKPWDKFPYHAYHLPERCLR